MSILKVQKLNFGYNKNLVLQNINFEIQSGDYVGLVGPNGGGKTTLVKIILGILKFDSGRVLLFDQEKIPNSQRSQIGYVPQRITNFNFPATVSEIITSNFDFGCNASSETTDNFKTNLNSFQKRKQPFSNFFARFDPKIQKLKSKKLQEILEITDLKPLENTQIGRLSGGQLQRVFIARSLINNPKLLILDEPTVGIDQVSQTKFCQFLKNLQQQMNLTILFISHDLEILSRDADYLLCVNQTLQIEKNPTNLPHLHFH